MDNTYDFDKEWEDFKNRRIYHELSPEILATIPDDKLEWAILDFISSRLTNHPATVADISNLSQGLQMMYSTFVLEGQVNNGGFNQFFVNSSGQFAAMAALSCDLIGASDRAEVVRKAIEIHEQEKGNAVLQSLYAQNTLEAFKQTYKLTKLGECDDAFYALDDHISELRLRYIRSHPEEFSAN